MKKIVYFMILVVLASCGPKLDEVISEKYPDGKPKRVDYYNGQGDSKYIAKSVFYYESGNKRVEGSYNKDGKKDGKWTYWYDNGNKWSEGYFTEGLDDKKRTAWHENGELHFTGRLDKGKRIGTWKFYDEKGNLTKELDYDKENPEIQ
jgi:antitoxin component YwqK of YwqJK toxin-antitoxin module